MPSGREQMSGTRREAGVNRMWLREYKVWCLTAPNVY